jgi:hypothetical protein
MAKSAYEAIKSHWVGVQRVREANVEQLRKEFSEIRFQEGESVDDFSMWKRRVPLARRTRQREQVATLGGLRSHRWGRPNTGWVGASKGSVTDSGGGERHSPGQRGVRTRGMRASSARGRQRGPPVITKLLVLMAGSKMLDLKSTVEKGLTD